MRYTYKRDRNFEQPFFNALVLKFDGKESRRLINGYPAYKIRCPYCGKKGAAMGTAKDKETFILLCPTDHCASGGSKTLHQLIQDHSNSEQWEAWREGHWVDNYPWFGIKSQTKKIKGDGKTFKEKQQIKSETARIYSSRSRK